MTCPACGRPLPDGADTCAECGCMLIQKEPTVHRTNQVWNTDIDREQNQRNSRTALIALGASVLLLIGLVIALLISAPHIGTVLLGERDEGQSFTERAEEFFQSFTDSLFGGIAPMPEAYASIPDGADREFVELFEEYLEKDYNDDYADSRLLADRYYEEFAHLKDASYADGKLAVYAAQTVQALDDLRKGADLTADLEDPSTTHDILWMEGCVGLCTVAEELYTRYGILYKDRSIPEYYVWLRPILQAELEVEYDLTAQLIGVDAVIPDDGSAPYLTYINHTPYTLDLIIYNDYETESDFLSEECSFTALSPDETVTIYLKKMPDDYENWYIGWYLETCSYNGEDIYTYDW